MPQQQFRLLLYGDGQHQCQSRRWLCGDGQHQCQSRHWLYGDGQYQCSWRNLKAGPSSLSQHTYCIFCVCCVFVCVVCFRVLFLMHCLHCLTALLAHPPCLDTLLSIIHPVTANNRPMGPQHHGYSAENYASSIIEGMMSTSAESSALVGWNLPPGHLELAPWRSGVAQIWPQACTMLCLHWWVTSHSLIDDQVPLNHLVWESVCMCPTCCPHTLVQNDF